jgi:hypothetical protein
MSKKGLFILICLSFALNLACQNAVKTNENINSVANVKESADIPPGFSTSPVPMSSNSTPGIPDPKLINANSLQKGMTPIPGIPDPKTIGKTPVPKKTPPIPGIPDEETLKKQMNTIIKDANIVNNPPKSQSVNSNRLVNKSKLRKLNP